MKDSNRIRTVSSENSSSSHQQSSSETVADHELLDAYSRAVTSVVDETIPSLISVTGTEKHGSGSGVLLSSDGYAITNSHVVSGQLTLVTKTSEGDRIEAKLVGDDPANDLSLIKLSASELPFAKLGDSSKLRVGQLVVAMGSPVGLHSTVSTGIVSALGRGMRGESGRLIENVIQHSAPINPGNSGGPLVDTRCQVVGINTAIIAYTQGIGFAVPAQTVDWFFNEVLNHGKVRRRMLGIAASTVRLSRKVMIECDLLSDTGVEVMELDATGTAAVAGVQIGDLVVSINDRVVEHVDDIHRLLGKLNSLSEILVTVVRRGRKIVIPIRFLDA